jgi:hypothetical protein
MCPPPCACGQVVTAARLPPQCLPCSNALLKRGSSPPTEMRGTPCPDSMETGTRIQGRTGTLTDGGRWASPSPSRGAILLTTGLQQLHLSPAGIC